MTDRERKLAGPVLFFACAAGCAVLFAVGAMLMRGRSSGSGGGLFIGSETAFSAAEKPLSEVKPPAGSANVADGEGERETASPPERANPYRDPPAPPPPGARPRSASAPAFAPDFARPATPSAPPSSSVRASWKPPMDRTRLVTRGSGRGEPVGMPDGSGATAAYAPSAAPSSAAARPREAAADARGLGESARATAGGALPGGTPRPLRGGAAGVVSSFSRGAVRGLPAEFAAPTPGPVAAVPASSGDEVGRTLFARAAGADLRSKPVDREGSDDLRLSQLVSGESLKVLGETKDGWVHVQSQRLTEFDPRTGDWKNTEGWVRRENLGSDASLSIPREPVPPSGARQAFVEALKKFEGTPYVWGGTNPGKQGGVDCSGLIVAALTDIGVRRVPRTAADQERAAQKLADPSQLQPGDLIFDGNPAHHVIAYLGGGQTIEAMDRKHGVVRMGLKERLQSVKQPYYGALLSQ
ncbi:MAG: SH3 domain-containing C40 family peptidase [Elusimicrobiota bacterium]|jgi:cell wall-associated NlpC family hydrolase